MSEADGYRLRPVREARSRDERSRRGELAGAAGDARDTAARLAEATRRVDEARAALEAARRTSGTSSSAAALARAEQFLVRRRRQLELAIDAQLRADALHRGQLAVVDTARGQLAQARARREVIERHFAHWRTERRKLAERRED